MRTWTRTDKPLSPETIGQCRTMRPRLINVRGFLHHVAHRRSQVVAMRRLYNQRRARRGTCRPSRSPADKVCYLLCIYCVPWL